VAKQTQTVFLDFEASSLGKDSYPIEVAWVFENGEEESHLIRPDPSWTDWDEDAQATHRITRDQLLSEGAPVGEVGRRMIAVLTGHALYATAPSWDGKWLSRLLRGAGLPRHALRLEDTEAAHRKAVLGVLHASHVPVELHEGILQDILRQAARRDDEQGPAAHRALDDARRELRLWQDIRRRAEESALRLSSALPGD
jgi:hypothetical protein